MAPRKTSVKKSPVKRKSTSSKSSSMVKKSTPKTMLKKHGKKLAALGLATLLASAGAGAYRNREMLKSILKRTPKGSDVRSKYTNIGVGME